MRKGTDALTAFFAGLVTIPLVIALIVFFVEFAHIIVPIIGIGIAAVCGLLILRDWDEGE